MNMKLYEIANEYQTLIADLEREEEITEISLIKFDTVNTAIENKAIAIATYIKNLEAEHDAIEKAKKAMAERELRLGRRIESLSKYLQSNMERCGITEISSSPYFSIKLKKCPLSVDTFNESVIPDDYKKTREITLLDKVKMKQEMLAGVIIPGASLKQNVRLEIN